MQLQFTFHFSIDFVGRALLLLKSFCNQTPQSISPSTFSSSYRTYQRGTVSIHDVVFSCLPFYQSLLVDCPRLRTSSVRVLSEFSILIYPPALPALTKMINENSVQTFLHCLMAMPKFQGLLYSKRTDLHSCSSSKKFAVVEPVIFRTSFITKHMYCCSIVLSTLFIVHEPLSRSQISFKTTSCAFVLSRVFSSRSASTSTFACFYSHNPASDVSFSFDHSAGFYLLSCTYLRVLTPWFFFQ